MKKNVLMVGPDLGVRGGTPSVEKVILDKAKYNDQINIYFIPAHRDLSKLGKLLFAFKGLLRFIVQLIKQKVDVVYIHMSADASFFRKSLFIMTGCLFKKRIIIHMHGGYFEEFYNQSSSHIKKYIHYIINSAYKIIVLTEEWKRFYETIISADKVVVVHNSVVVAENRYNPQGTLITFLGRLNQKKGAYDVLKIAGEIISQYPQIRFMLVGDGEVEEVRKVAAGKGLNEQIIVPGWLSKNEIEKILQETVIYILPSYAEGLPMSVLEAMAFGIPVVTTDVGGLHEVIESNVNGILIDPGDITALRENILRLLAQEDLRRNFSQYGYETIRQKFNSELFFQKISDVIMQSSI